METKHPGRRGTGGWRALGAIVLLVALIFLPAVALAGPRSGGSFGGRLGFRSGGGYSMPRGTGSGYGYGGGHSFFFLPSFGWGGMGYGGGGFSSLLVLGVLGFAAFSLVRAARRYRSGGGGWGLQNQDDEVVASGRGYVYRLQIALGRSARGIQDRLARFASEGDTSSEAGLASLLQQTSLELLREKDSIRYAGVDASGPMSLTNAETKLNSFSLAERSRFQVERVRGADGNVRRATEAAEEGKEALEYVVVTMIVATRSPAAGFKTLGDRADLEALLGQLGSASPDGLLGLEVVWTPADPNDSMTETDLMTTYPELHTF
ncbi:MAG TPA: DUF1517 domain-containing protein [Polyangia bacterium]|jgi:uncharacterized membrane protein